MEENRNLRVMINKAGGNAGPEAVGYKLSLPSRWVKSLNITKDDRTLKASFDGKKITLEKVEFEND